MDMHTQAAAQQFESLVGIRFQLYNSLFTSLPFHKIENTGILLSMFLLHCEEGYRQGSDPDTIIRTFTEQFAPDASTSERYDLLFRFIQYAERQVVLFDALEDAAFLQVNEPSGIRQMHAMPYGVSSAETLHPEVRLVLTAHPTQFYNGAVLGIISDLAIALKDDDPQLINDYLRQLGRTPFFNKEKPSPYDEAVNLMWYLQHVFYPAVGEMMYALMPAPGQPQPQFQPRVRIGFWPGGDRDGNQFVRTDTTLKVAAALHRRILRCYHKDARMLKRRLTFKGVEEAVSKLERSIYNALFSEQQPLTVAGVLAQLDHIKAILQERHNSLFIELVDAFIEKVKVFGLHFASLDIRQDSKVHRNAIRALSGKVDGLPAGYPSLPDEGKIRILTALHTPAQEVKLDDEVAQDTLEVMKAMMMIQATNGTEACNRYIISHCTSVIDVLEVYALLHIAGWPADELHVDIVPLFETVDDLRGCGAVMEALYAEKTYRSHLRGRNNRQTIMLGFSDGTKDGGYLMANWAIYKAKEELTRISRAHDIDISFFDGRGGPPARGGGKTQKFYASMGNNIAGKDIQLTIQGQTISSNFGTVPTARYNMEQLIAASVAGHVRANAGPTLLPDDDALLQRLADASYESYKELKEDPAFLDYLNEVSPLRYYADTNIGSRPAKRNTGRLNLDDLRAIPYVGAWSQLKQNVPGYYGLGTALRAMKEAGEWSSVVTLYHRSAFFRALLDNCEMAMKKSFFPLTAYLAADQRYGKIWQMVYDEFRLTGSLLLELSGNTEIMGGNPVSAASIGMRERIVLPLLTIQQYALGKLRKEPDEYHEVFEKLVVRCSFGIINAGRNAV